MSLKQTKTGLRRRTREQLKLNLSLLYNSPDKHLFPYVGYGLQSGSIHSLKDKVGQALKAHHAQAHQASGATKRR